MGGIPVRGIVFFVVLLAFWAVLSGKPTHPFLAGAGLVTTALVTWVAFKRDIVIRDWGFRSFGRLLLYLPWLFWQIVVANVRVIRIVWSPPGRLGIAPEVVDVPCSLATASGRVVYANSITLTPGTVTLQVEPESLKVHALTAADAEDLLDGAMQERVKKLEPK